MLTLCFATTERLVVTDPTTVEVGDDEQLVVPHATHISWGWHYYGRPQTADNWCEESYVISGDSIRFERTGPLMPGTEQWKYTGNKVVELL